MQNYWKYRKLSLGMQRPIVNNELSKERCATSGYLISHYGAPLAQGEH